jgi:N-acetylglucosaminyldiphosphoundecaprenol N-acetyl-beta-D-mannosaminyltransferase
MSLASWERLIMNSQAKRQRLFGLAIDAATLGQVLTRCEAAIRTRSQVLVGVVNAAKLVNLRKDARLRNSLLECDMILADGQSVVWASKILSRPLPERVAGIDLFEGLLDLADQKHYSVYLLGATPAVVAALAETISNRFPNAVIAGWRNGYFADEEAESVAYEITTARPDMLFLGMASPKKEIFLGRFGASLGVPVLHGVGGSFDVMAGVTQRAPESWQRLGFEWAYRLKQEPRRLWRRYLRTNTRFIVQVIIEHFRPTPAWERQVPPNLQASEEITNG